MATNTQGFGIQLATGGFSLEANTIFSNYTLALAYARSSAAYVGKVISVTNGTDKGVYSVEAIGENASLKKVGSDIDLSNYATISYVNTKLSSVYNFKGSVSNYYNLPTSNLSNGDVYNIESEFTIGSGINAITYPKGTNVAYVASSTPGEPGHWDPLGGTSDILNWIEVADTNENLIGD